MAEFAPKNNIPLVELAAACVKAAASATAADPKCAASAMVTARMTLLFVKPAARCQIPLALLLLLLLLRLPLLALATTLLRSADSSRLAEGVST